MQDLLKAIFAGIMIGIAGLIYLTIDITWVAAILFSIGLIIICIKKYNLYTGKIGYIKSYKELSKMIIYIIGNFIGVYLISLLSNKISYNLVLNKLQIPYNLLLFKSIGCGFLMYLAVDIYKQKQSIIGIITCVPAFILCGFEHSIADIFYICNAKIFNTQTLNFIIIVIIGNAIGALLHKCIKEV